MDYVMVAILFTVIGFAAGALIYRNNAKKLNGYIERLEKEIINLKSKIP